jgi:hypothetical protein
MPAEPQTMRVMPAHPSQGEWVVINAADFDPVLHVDYDERAGIAAAADRSVPARRGRPPKNPELKGA